jgi:hydrogenase-4 component B
VTSLDLIIAAALLAAASGLPAWCLPRGSRWGQSIAAAAMCTSAIVGLTGAWQVPFESHSGTVTVLWPVVGDVQLGVDALSALFLIPIFAMGGLGAIYGLGYWPQPRHRRNARKLQLGWGVLVAGMTLLVVSRHALAFLLGWELMALSAFFLVSTEDGRAECRWAGWLYLISAHVSTLSLFALFALWRWATGSYLLHPAAVGAVPLGVMNALFVLSLVGFGVKAGIMPLHFWLPTAHAAAPSHVSAMLSGVVIKMGIYGLVRMLSLLPDPPAAWGGSILTAGAVSGILGVLFAIGQHDLKRLLAYHSVENIGIILMGLGLAMLGRSADQPQWIVLGLAGCLLHVWNHGLFKSLLFLCAGSVVHATHTREIDRLGGLAKRMPWTAGMFIVGAVAICGLPPLNGFVSELFVYLGLLQTVAGSTRTGAAAVLAAPVLATIGALAVACFVKVYGAVFSGSPRTQAAADAHESPLTMLAPLVLLACGCATIGAAPRLVGPILDAAIVAWLPEIGQSGATLAALAPLNIIGWLSLSLIGLVALLGMLIAPRLRQSSWSETWDCGYAQPTHRMQYSASSFAQTIVTMFRWVLRPRTHQPDVRGLFPRPTAFHSHVDDPMLDQLLVPAGRAVERGFGWFHRFQQGLTQHYVLYILVTVVLMLGTLIPIDEFLARLFAR